MSDSRVNRYRSGAKRPYQETLVSHNDDGSLTVVVADMANARIQSHTFPGGRKTDRLQVDGVSEDLAKEKDKNG